MRAPLVAAAAAAMVALAGDSRAQAPAGDASGAACPAGNLLAQRRPWAWSDTRRALTLPTDGVAAPEGTVWDAGLALLLETGAATITWDLQAPTTVREAWIQADANDYYTVWGSLDGRAWSHLGRIDPAEGHGLRARRLGLGGHVVRYLRFGEGDGDSAYSLSEIQVFCQAPDSFPPPGVRIDKAPAAATNIYTYWNDEASARWELILALLGLGLLHWGAVLRRTGRPDHRKKLRDGLLGALGLLAAGSYVNFGAFHFGVFVHEHEWTHYYMGAKYFPELKYDRLYECLSVADAEDGLRRRVELRKITNLRTNMLEKTDELLKDPDGRCKRHFTAQRWEAFRRDVRFFRGRQGAKGWDDVQVDHGYNGTPVWNIAGHALANTGPASAGQIAVLALLDPLYLLATILVVWWAFGWRVLSVALLVFATNFPSRFYWTGGAYLRWDWIFYLVAAICCLRRGRPVLGGAALAYATLLRVFPLFVFAGPGLALAWGLLRERKLDARYARFFVGAAVAVALLVPTSLVVSGGVEGYRRFVQNTMKHKETPMTNLMGLRTVMAYRPSEVGRRLNDNRDVDPWGKWKAARLRAWHQAQPVYAVVVLAFLALLGLAVRRAEPWAAAALGVTLIPMGVELLSYYFAFILGAALLYQRDERAGRLLLLLTAFTQFVAWAPLRNMSRAFDEMYTLMSAATVAAFFILAWWLRDQPTVAALWARLRRTPTAPAAGPPTPEGAGQGHR